MPIMRSPILRLAQKSAAGDDARVSSSRWLFGGTSVAVLGGCVAIAGVGDFSVDPCLDPGACADASLDAPALPDTSVLVDAGEDAAGDAAGDAAIDAPPPPSPGLSAVALGGTGVAVGRPIVATLTTRDDTGNKVPRTGAKIVFTFSGGTSKVKVGPITDDGDGTYHATLTGDVEGTPIGVSATLDGAPLKTPAAPLRVVNRVAAGLVVALDAENADGAGNLGSKSCPAAGATKWVSLGATPYNGTLAGMGNNCGAGSGWAGAGKPGDPAYLSFDGVDDHVDFGAVPPPLTTYTILAWTRMSGAGTAGDTGSGGIPATFPLVTKGTAEAENANVDINFHLSITPANVIGFDYELAGTSVNSPLLGATAITQDKWVMVGATLDSAASVRSVWLDGAVDATLAPTGAPSPGNNSRFVIGGANRTAGVAVGRYKGDVAVVLVYDRALGAAEIRQSCHSFSSRFEMLTCPP